MARAPTAPRTKSRSAATSAVSLRDQRRNAPESRPVRIALMVEGQEGVSWDEWLALAEACEEHSVEALFRSDHFLSQAAPGERVATDAWTLLAALAARTSSLRLGTLVSPVTFRHPSVLAKAAATVDDISGGRVEVGMGAGWMELEH